jgi:hypothetical protein
MDPIDNTKNAPYSFNANTNYKDAATIVSEGDLPCARPILIAYETASKLYKGGIHTAGSSANVLVSGLASSTSKSYTGTSISTENPPTGTPNRSELEGSLGPKVRRDKKPTHSGLTPFKARVGHFETLSSHEAQLGTTKEIMHGPPSTDRRRLRRDEKAWLPKPQGRVRKALRRVSAALSSDSERENRSATALSITHNHGPSRHDGSSENHFQASERFLRGVTTHIRHLEKNCEYIGSRRSRTLYNQYSVARKPYQVSCGHTIGKMNFMMPLLLQQHLDTVCLHSRLVLPQVSLICIPGAHH